MPERKLEDLEQEFKERCRFYCPGFGNFIVFDLHNNLRFHLNPFKGITGNMDVANQAMQTITALYDVIDMDELMSHPDCDLLLPVKSQHIPYLQSQLDLVQSGDPIDDDQFNQTVTAILDAGDEYRRRLQQLLEDIQLLPRRTPFLFRTDHLAGGFWEYYHMFRPPFGLRADQIPL
ncbi:MAG: hypothetical protein ABII07_06000 [Patescibacteria group bacterium]|nr:hypothetical protein [Patescibacteria group bacterium]